jgi:aminoglycoside phosphotransferase (APT) family kinase protein
MEEKHKLERQIRELYPNQPLKILAEGGMSYAFEVGDYIIRVPRNNSAANGYEFEEKFLTFLNGKINTVEIPNIKIIKTPFLYSIHKKLNGLHWDGKAYKHKTEKEKDLLANDCAIFFAELHSIEVSKINTKIPELKPIQQDIEKYLAKDLSGKEILKIIKYTEILYTLQDKLLIHNDFYPPNFFIDTNYRLKCVIDFARACYCNYNFEFRKIISYEEGEQDFWKRIVGFYEEITDRKIDIEIIKVIDIYNYMDFLSYFAKHFKIEKGNIRILNRWNEHIEYVKDKIRKL